MIAGTDEEVDVFSFDGERWRSQRAGGAVSLAESIHQPFAEVAGDLVPRIHVGLGGPVSECFAGDLPVAVAVALEVGDEDVFGGDTGSGEEEEARAKTQD